MSTGIWIGTLASSAPTNGDFDSLATVSVGSGGAASINFSSIPQTYTHLQLRGLFRASATNAGTPRLSLNGSTNIQYQHMAADGTNTGQTITTAADGNWFALGGQRTAQFSAFVCDIFDYRNTSKTKTLRTVLGVEENGAGAIYYFANIWAFTNSINQITFTLQGANFTQHSTMALYGVSAP